MATKRPRKPYTPPLQRAKPWMSIAIRMETYAKLRELSEFHGRGMGDQMQVLVDPAFDEALKTVVEREVLQENGMLPAAPPPKPIRKLKKSKKAAQHVQVKRPVVRKYHL